MEIVQSLTHESCVATYQTLEVARLNEALKACGIADQAKRREICEHYFFDAGYFLDSCWFEEAGLKIKPGVYFAEIDSRGRKTGTVHMPEPSHGTCFHEYAHGAAAWLFDDHKEDSSEITTGDCGEADPGEST